MSNPESESESESDPHVFKLFGKTIQTADTDEKQPQASASAKVETTTREEEEEEEQETETETAATRAAAAAAGGGALPCPRCRSRDTKFCYFNNYNVNQPRHFCKACHRYWTAGGTLRNVPVGAGRRKNRAPPPTTSPSASVGTDRVLRLAGR